MSAAKRKRAVIITRVSTDEQAGEGSTSLQEQARLCEEFINSRGWEFTGQVYEDAGVSGTAKTRPALTRALRAAANREYDVAVVLNLSRLARTTAISINIAAELTEYGVAVASVQESFIDTSTPAGRLVFTQFAGFYEFDREQIVHKTAMGLRAIARSGRLPGGASPYGWMRVGERKTSRVVPNPAEREVIWRMYELLVHKRMNAQQVAQRLNDEGIKPRHAERWDSSTVRSIGRNPVLWSSEVVWGEVDKGQKDGQRSHRARVNYDGTPRYGDPITVTLGDPVMTRAQFNSMIRALARPVVGKPSAPVQPRMLSGRVYTAEGHQMYSVNLDQPWEGAMRCQRRRSSYGDQRCDCPQLRAKPLEDLVWAEVTKVLSDPAALESMARAYLELPEDPTGDDSPEVALSGVAEQIAKHERALARAEKAVLFADSEADEARHAALIAGIRQELVTLRAREQGYRALLASTATKGEALRDLVALAERARGRLHTMSTADRADVLRVMQIEVRITGAVVRGQAESLVVTGVVDPRLFGSAVSDAETSDAYPSAQSHLAVAGCDPSHSG